VGEIRLALEPEDELNHDAGDVGNFNESMYFNAFGGPEEGSAGGWFRMGNRVNEGYAELSVCVYLPDGRIGFVFKRPRIETNEVFDAGGMRIEILEPLVRQRVVYEGTVCLLERPWEMADPRRAFAENPMVPCSVDVTWEGVSPVHGGKPVDAHGREVDTGNGFAKAHYEQLSRATGAITVGDEVVPLVGHGIRDKSWGPRFWQAVWWYRWLPVAFGEDFGMTVSLVGSQDGDRRPGGWVFDGGSLHDIRDVTVRSRYDGRGHQTRLVADVLTDDGAYVLEGEVRSLIPLRNRRSTPDGDELRTRITEGWTRYRVGDREASGLSEYLDQIVEDRPVGRAEDEEQA
jgi:hypothetical protein